MDESRASERDETVGELLAEGRPRLTDDDLSRIHERIVSRGTVRRTSGLLATALLVFGLAGTATGTSLVAAELGGDIDAAGVQYAQDVPPPPVADVPDQEEGGGTEVLEETVFGGSASSGGGSDQAPPSKPQSGEQLTSSGGGSLAFTGFVAIPLLLVGLGLVGAGAALRRRNAQP